VDARSPLSQISQTLNAHAASKGAEIFEKYGPCVGWPELLRLLTDRSCVRFPCDIQFAAEPLLPGEFAHPVARAVRPEEGFTIFVHPVYENQLQQVPLLVLYQLVLVNYGEFASRGDAEVFGAASLGLTVEEYYDALCALADQVAT
jgi:hypothetical protein